MVLSVEWVGEPAVKPLESWAVAEVDKGQVEGSVELSVEWSVEGSVEWSVERSVERPVVVYVYEPTGLCVNSYAVFCVKRKAVLHMTASMRLRLILYVVLCLKIQNFSCSRRHQY